MLFRHRGWVDAWAERLHFFGYNPQFSVLRCCIIMTPFFFFFIFPVFTLVSVQSGKGIQDFNVTADPWDRISWQYKYFFQPFFRVALVLVCHYMSPTPVLVSWMSWLTSGALQEQDSIILVSTFQLWIFSDSVIVMKPSSLMSATLVQQREHKHADKGRGWHCPCSWQLAIGAIYLYYPNMPFSVLS